MTRSRDVLTAAAIFLAVSLLSLIGQIHAQTAANPNIRVGGNDIGGVVTGMGGPEAGVWVVAETTDLPTKYAKIVVTDDRGRFLDQPWDAGVQR